MAQQGGETEDEAVIEAKEEEEESDSWLEDDSELVIMKLEQNYVQEFNSVLEKASCMLVALLVLIIAFREYNWTHLLPFNESINFSTIPKEITVSIPVLQNFVNQLYRSDLICLICSCIAFPNYHQDVAHFHLV